MKFQTSIFALVAALLCAPVLAQDAKLGSIHVIAPVARATMPGQTSGVVYMTLENTGTGADKLLTLASPAAAQVAIHTMSLFGTVMRMREIDDLALPPAASIAMQPDGGYHIMLMGLKQPLKTGGKVALTLKFEKAGTLKLLVPVGASQVVDDAGTAHKH